MPAHVCDVKMAFTSERRPEIVGIREEGVKNHHCQRQTSLDQMFKMF